jgi:hypothetical protein
MDSTRNVLGEGIGAPERCDENWETGSWHGWPGGAAGHQVFWSGHGGWKKYDHEIGSEIENDDLHLGNGNDDLNDHLEDNVNDL